MSLDKQNKIWHILHIIRDLEAGKTINIKEYATINNLSNRTVQRYFERGGQLYDLYSDKLIGHNGTFAIANENIVKDMLLAPTTSNELERIIDLYYMINPAIFVSRFFYISIAMNSQFIDFYNNLRQFLSILFRTIKIQKTTSGNQINVRKPHISN